MCNDGKITLQRWAWSDKDGRGCSDLTEEGLGATHWMVENMAGLWELELIRSSWANSDNPMGCELRLGDWSADGAGRWGPATVGWRLWPHSVCNQRAAGRRSLGLRWRLGDA